MTLAAVPDRTAPPTLAQRLEDPETAEAISTILDHADVLALLVESLDGALRRSETILDSVVDGLNEARLTAASTPGLEGLDGKATASAAARLASSLPRVAPAIERVVESGAIDQLTSPAMVHTLTVVTQGLNDGLQDFESRPVEVGGVMSVLRLLRDPDVARALSFFATIGRAIGRDLKERG